MGERVGLSHITIRDTEFDKVSAPSIQVLAKISQIFNMDEQKEVLMYELAAKSKKHPTVPGDILEYITSNYALRNTIRVAKKLNVTDEELGEVIQQLIKNRGKEYNVSR